MKSIATLHLPTDTHTTDTTHPETNVPSYPAAASDDDRIYDDPNVVSMAGSMDYAPSSPFNPTVEDLHITVTDNVSYDTCITENSYLNSFEESFMRAHQYTGTQTEHDVNIYCSDELYCNMGTIANEVTSSIENIPIDDNVSYDIHLYI